MNSPQIRRIVTGHDDKGAAVYIEDALMDPAPLREDSQTEAAFFNVWTTDSMPVDNTDATLAVQREGSETTFRGTGKGSVLRIGILEPGTRSPMHRTESLDYALCLEGECDLELDGGECRTVRAGEIVIQRGTNHVWHNRSSEPCRFAWILLDSAPIMIDGEPLSARWVDDREPAGEGS
ncbi:MAG TPA: cupin domain-containing protein [Solirubrobacterales bacterium]